MRIMDVIFQPSRGSPFYIEVGYFDTVLEIKEKIQKDQSIPISIHKSEILDRSRIHLLVASDAGSRLTKSDELSPSKIQLLLKMPSSKLGIALEMDVSETIRRLKEKIHEMEGVPIRRLMCLLQINILDIF
ncbi:hypothetical protein Sango_0258700 [Sesamum angolense]|uniref:Ubiquitin-like domain-containing protein n=1 Tax=Sesamum angolense TaxID=2727404 RepID=A0AAE2C7F1_9LAMI|nr:hypothetical protein Sango_0258700 [Sesamum angolense]